MASPPRRVVIVGSGFGGLFTARALRGAPVDVTLIDRVNHHLFQPLLYQVATGILPEGEVAPATRDVLRRYDNVRVQLAEVRRVDLARRVVVAEQPGRTVETPYDTLVVATGLETSYFGHDERARVAPGLKSIDDALELRGRIFDAFEMAETEPDPGARPAWLTFVVVGGGPTGVEMAGQILQLSRRALRGNFRTIDPASARVVVVEGTGALLPSFGDRASHLARRDLARMGAEILTGHMVVDMDDEHVTLRDGNGRTQRIEARTKIWAAGMEAAPLVRQVASAAGAPVDRRGRVQVLPDCTVPGHPEVFVIGDAMALDDLPGLAEVAIQSGIHAAAAIRRRAAAGEAGEAVSRDGAAGGTADARTTRPFRYRDLGSMAVVSQYRAVARLGPVTIGGVPGWCLWLVVHLTFLTGFKNRMAALSQWVVAFLARGRAERVITRQQIQAREAIASVRAPVGDGDRGPPSTLVP